MRTFIIVLFSLVTVGCTSPSYVPRTIDFFAMRKSFQWTQITPLREDADIPVYSITNRGDGGRIDVYAPLTGGRDPRHVLDEAAERLILLRPAFDAVEIGDTRGVRRTFIDHALRAEGEMVAFVPRGHVAWHVAVMTLPRDIGPPAKAEWAHVFRILTST